MAAFRRRRVSNTIIALAVAVTIVFVWIASREEAAGTDARPPPQVKQPVDDPHLPCWSLSGANDTLVVLKTGATELADKLPVHFETTFKCYPNYVIFSDVEEVYRGERIRDALDTVSPSIIAKHRDFELYRRLQRDGRQGLAPGELSGTLTKLQTEGVGKPANPGWQLDKWKFIPMLNKTLHLYPGMKWYMFIETDTYMLWSTLLRYQSELDPTQKYYGGAQIWIGPIEFGHGGSGFLVSNAALKRLVEFTNEDQAYWERITEEQWAGDCVLGKAFKDSGTPLTRAWPIIQGDHPGVLPYDRTDNAKRMWCHPTISYHHLSPTTVKEMWDFEQDWMANGGSAERGAFLRHRDVFEQFIMPRLREPKSAWDNRSEDPRDGVKTLEACRAACEADPLCLQYMFDGEANTCKTLNVPKMGDAARPDQQLISGWMYSRIKAWKNKIPPCDSDSWSWIQP